MKKKIIIGCFSLFLIVTAGYIAYHHLFRKDPVSISSTANTQKSDTDQQSDIVRNDPKQAFPQISKTSQPENRKVLSKKRTPNESIQEEIEEQPIEYPKDIKEIREQLYDLGIEYIEDIELLDTLVQTGDTDAREFWGGDWRSADDFKAEEDGFKLEQNADGTYKFTPDEVTARSYSFFETPQSFFYDQDRNEFNWDVDYYGKTITNKFKFINDETAVLMIISGRKVTTNIYRKNYPPDEEYILPEE